MWFIAAHVIPLVALAVYLAIPRFDKEMHDPKEREELRPLLERMLAMYRDGDTVILIDHYPSYAFKYYTRGRTIATHPGKTIWKDSVLVRYIAKLAPESGRVWIVMSHTPREAMLEVVAKVSRRWPTVAVMDRRDAIVAFFAAEPKPRRLRTDEYDFRPPNRPERAAMAHDDDPETNWLSEGYKEPGWHIDIELHEPTALSAVILNAKIWPDDWSHELYAAVQVDGDDSWQSTGLSVWEGPRTTVNFDGPPVPVRRVRLTNAERSDTYCWSVHELEIWARPAPAASQPTR